MYPKEKQLAFPPTAERCWITSIIILHYSFYYSFHAVLVMAQGTKIIIVTSFYNIIILYTSFVSIGDSDSEDENRKQDPN